MKIAILGTGTVAQSLSEKFIELEYDVTLGTKNPQETKGRTTPNQVTGVSFSDWYKVNSKVKLSRFANVTQDVGLVINATQGTESLQVLNQIGKESLKGKILLDIANPFDASKGVMTICNTDSLGEQIQAAFPDTKVVKSFNTMNAYIMTHPNSIPGNHNVFISGNDEYAKSVVKDLFKTIGWKENNIIDLGDISTARGTELLLPIGLRLYGVFGHSNFNFHIQIAG